VVAVKTSDADAFLAGPAQPVVLVFGPDAGLVSERVRALIKASVTDPTDPFSLVRIEGDEIAADPGRLIEEAQTIPLTGGPRAVWVKAGARNIAPAVEALLALGESECRVVIEAGDLRRNAPLRLICERATKAAAVACYPDAERELERLIDSEMRAAKLALKPEARALLVGLLGGDRAASRGELRKLTLYARGTAIVGVEEVAAVVSDASALEVDDLIDAAFAGRSSDVEGQLGKLRTASVSVGSIFFAALRQVAQLHKWRLTIEEGGPFSVKSLQPPLHFRRHEAVETALRAWTAARLVDAMAELADATLASRRTPALAETIAARAVLTIAMKARQRAG
jgi:DNA polymerase III subunit delta